MSTLFIISIDSLCIISIYVLYICIVNGGVSTLSQSVLFKNLLYNIVCDSMSADGRNPVPISRD